MTDLKQYTPSRKQTHQAIWFQNYKQKHQINMLFVAQNLFEVNK